MKTLKEDPLTIINGSLFPNEEHIYLRSITTLNLEHIFSLLNRKHGCITLKSFTEEYPQMFLESIKILLPTKVRGFVHSDSYKRHWYATSINGELPESVATSILEYITQESLRNRKRRKNVT